MIEISDDQIESKYQRNSSKVIDFLNGSQSREQLYEPQIESLRNLKNFFDVQKNEIALIILPTGTGKSGVAALAPYVLKSNSVLIITPSVVISDQLFNDMACNTSSLIQTFYEKVLIIEPNKRKFFAEVGYKVMKRTSVDVFKSNAESVKLTIANAHKFGTTSNVNIQEIPNDLFDLVIVDEAHHYPALTWKSIIGHFKKVKKLFLTATPVHTSKNNKIRNIVGENFQDQLKNYVAFKFSREEAVNKGIIRDIEFLEVGSKNCTFESRCQAVIDEIIKKIAEHDQENNYQHQAMILVHKKTEADNVKLLYNNSENRIGIAETYHGDIRNENAFTDFRTGNNNVRVLVVCKRALEGFDRKEISVLGILRNIQPSSVVLFTQFIGRAVRCHKEDSANFKACLISHEYYNQRENFDKSISEDYWADEDPEDDYDGDDF